jgi:hypothetical protein
VKGFSMYSEAPNLMACTAERTVAYPVIINTGRAGLARLMSLSTSIPLRNRRGKPETKGGDMKGGIYCLCPAHINFTGCVEV